MFFNLTILSLSLFAALTAVTAKPWNRESVHKCNVGSVQCCNSVQAPQSGVREFLAGLVGVAVGDITGQVGVQCNPITVIGAGFGTSCNAQPVCCDKNYMGGLVTAGCTPINVGL